MEVPHYRSAMWLPLIPHYCWTWFSQVVLKVLHYHQLSSHPTPVGSERVNFLLLGDRWSPGSSHCLYWHHREVGTNLITTWWDEGPGSLPGLLRNLTTREGGEKGGPSLTDHWGWNSVLPTLIAPGWGWGGLGPQFSLRGFTGVEHFTSESFLSFSSFSWGEQAFVGAICCLCLLSFPGSWLLQHPVWGVGDTKKLQVTYYPAVPQLPRSLAGLPCSLHLPQLSGVCFTCDDQGVWSY